MSDPVSLIEVCQTYDPDRAPAQTALLGWFNTQLHDPSLVSGAVLAEFARLWHETTALQPPAIDLLTVCQTYRQEQQLPTGVPPHRDVALYWLEQQLLSEAPALLTTFRQAWAQPDSVDVNTLTLPPKATITQRSQGEMVPQSELEVLAELPAVTVLPTNAIGMGAGEDPYPRLAIGSQDTGPSDGPVHQVQRLLKYKFGYGRVGVNGEFDVVTEQAVRDLQLKRFGTAQVTGVVDDRTWQALLAESHDRWLAMPDPLMTGEVDLVEVARYFRPENSDLYGRYHQGDAIRWLQSQLPVVTCREFAQRYRADASDAQPPLDLVSIFAYYKDLPHQTEALQWLQTQIPAAILQDFAAYWRNPHLYPPDRPTPPGALPAAAPGTDLTLPSTAVALPLTLLRAYQQIHPNITPDQQAALEWLQTQVPAPVLQEFSRLWSYEAG